MKKLHPITSIEAPQLVSHAGAESHATAKAEPYESNHAGIIETFSLFTLMRTTTKSVAIRTKPVTSPV